VQIAHPDATTWTEVFWQNGHGLLVHPGLFGIRRITRNPADILTLEQAIVDAKEPESPTGTLTLSSGIVFDGASFCNGISEGPDVTYIALRRGKQFRVPAGKELCWSGMPLLQAAAKVRF
jgi:hypothetical protein